MKKSRPIILALCAILLVAGTIVGTIAYLTDSSSIVNTFTVGKVELALSEAVVDEYGNPLGGRNDAGNRYHLIPGKTYTKDPTVTILNGSEEAYVRMMLSFNCAGELDAIFAPEGADLTEIFGGYDPSVWIYSGLTRGTDNTITYEFRYKETVLPNGANLALDALFDTFTIPTYLTGDQLESIATLEINVEAHAIQATGFADANAAWNAFSK